MLKIVQINKILLQLGFKYFHKTHFKAGKETLYWFKQTHSSGLITENCTAVTFANLQSSINIFNIHSSGN